MAPYTSQQHVKLPPLSLGGQAAKPSHQCNRSLLSLCHLPDYRSCLYNLQPKLSPGVLAQQLTVPYIPFVKASLTFIASFRSAFTSRL
jgi:hypothetical protein